MPPTLVPLAHRNAISWYENHLDPWNANQPSIGVTLKQVADISAATAAALNAFNAAELTRQEAQDATQTLRAAIADMRRTGSAFVNTVRAFAVAQNNQQVYSLASIPPPAPGSPLPAPATPTHFSGQLNSDGHIEIKWKANIRGRMFFAIERQIVPLGGIPRVWENRGSVSGSTYLDTAVPPGAITMNYRIATQRGTIRSVFTDPISILLATPGTPGIPGIPGIIEAAA